MRISPDQLHRAIWQAADQYEQTAWSGAMHQNDPRSFAKHQSVWMRTYGAQFLLGTVAYVGLAIGALVFSRAISSPAPFLGFLAGMAAHLVLTYRKHKRTLTVDELESLIPLLTLSDIATLYAQCVVEIYRQPLDKHVRDETLAELRSLMDDDSQLEFAREKLHSALAESDQLAAEQEAADLSRKLEAAQDPLARQAYADSLALARDRLESIQKHRPLLERIDAQSAMVRQTLLKLRTDLGRASASGLHGTSLVPENLRISLSGIRDRADEVELAVQELNRG